MVKFFAIEFQNAKQLVEELKKTNPKSESNEDRLLKIVSDYTDEIGKLGGLMRDYYEKKPVSLEEVLHTLRAINQFEKPLITEIQKSLFERFDQSFLQRRHEELEHSNDDTTQVNTIWERAIHHREIDFYQWFSADLRSERSWTNTQVQNAHLFDWLDKNLDQVESLIQHDGETGFDWAYDSPEFEKDAEETLPPQPDSPQTPTFPRFNPKNLKPFIEAPTVVKRRPKKPTFWEELESVTFREFRSKLGPTLIR